MIQVLVQITSAGASLTGGTFTVMAYNNGVMVQILAVGVTLAALQAGITYTNVPIGSTHIRIQATNGPSGCTNYVEQPISFQTTTTTTSTTTLPTTTSTTTTACFPLGNPYIVGVGNTTGESCTDLNDSPITVYSNSGTFTPGMILYTDECMTTLLTGFDYIVLQSTTDIFNLNDVTGELGADTGIDC